MIVLNVKNSKIYTNTFFDGLIDCSICLEKYNSDIVIFPCGHSFCNNCIKERVYKTDPNIKKYYDNFVRVEPSEFLKDYNTKLSIYDEQETFNCLNQSDTYQENDFDIDI